MALEHALLVSLREKPGSWLDLTRRFERSIGQFWRATHQQMDRMLSRMEVVVATGVAPRVPVIEGIADESVVSYADVLRGRAVTGKRVAVVGAIRIGLGKTSG